MRFVELRLSADGAGLPLHPRITFLRGLEPVERVSLVGMVHDVALGETPEWDGVAEIDDHELGLADAVREAGKTADSGLIVAAESLPEPAGPLPLDPEAADRAVAEAEERVASITESIASLAEDLGSAGTVRSDMRAHLASARGRIDREAEDQLDQADAALHRAAQAAGRDLWAGTPDVADRIDVLRELVADLDERLDHLPSGDRAALAAAAATAHAARSTGSVPCPHAAALAHAWDSLQQRLRGLESRFEAEGGGHGDIGRRLETARTDARNAEEATVPRAALPEEAALLERLHDAMLEAESRVGRGVRRTSARDAYERAREDLEAALEPLGYPTWTAFRMGNGTVSVTPEALAAHEQAQEDLEAAEVEWAELMLRIEADPELKSVLESVDEVRRRAVARIGSDPLAAAEAEPTDLSDALREITVDATEVDATKGEAVEALLVALAEAGARGHEEVRAEVAIVLLAGSWLDLLDAADAAGARLRRDRERAVAELGALESLGDGSDDGPADELAAVRDAEEAVAATREALCDAVQASLELFMLAATELTLAQQHDDGVTELEAAEVLRDLALRRRDGTGEADGVADLADRVPRGAAGPVPMVVVMGESPASALDALPELPADVQILVIGEGEGIDEWAEAVGPDVASVVEIHSFV